MFGRREARALQKIHHTGRNQGKLFTGFAGGGLVFATHFRVFFQELFAVASHEGKLQRPPGQPHHGHPDQLLLEKKFQQRNASVQQMLQHQNVDP